VLSGTNSGVLVPWAMLAFLIGHNVPESVSVFLREEGFDAKMVKEIGAELPDEEIAKVAKAERCAIFDTAA
jgi:RNA-binding protein YhbY